VTGVIIEMNQHVSLTFSLKYLVNFSKSSTLSNKVQLMMSNDVPLLVRVLFIIIIIIVHYYRWRMILNKDIFVIIWLPRLVMTSVFFLCNLFTYVAIETM
jgi:hypothetical protein